MELVAGQAPYAVILGCSDSRVPAEIVFDQGLGDLFVVRVAGNICAPSQIASVEFAAQEFGARLVVVLGHTRCGAVMATLDALKNPDASISGHLNSIVERIRPAVAEYVAGDDPARISHAVRANVRQAADALRHESALIEHLILEEGLAVVGAEYALDSGAVDFFDGLPE